MPCMFEYVCMLDAKMEQTLNKRVLSHALTFYSGLYSFLAVHRIYFALVPFHFLCEQLKSQEKDSKPSQPASHPANSTIVKRYWHKYETNLDHVEQHMKVF